MPGRSTNFLFAPPGLYLLSPGFLSRRPPCVSPPNTVFSQCGGVRLSHTFGGMNEYIVCQIQQIDRAKTFADIRRIEDRASRMTRVTPEVRRGSGWLLRAWAAAHVRSRHAAPPTEGCKSHL